MNEDDMATCLPIEISAPRFATRLTGIAIVTAISLLSSGCGSVFYAGQRPSATHRQANTHVSEEIRASIHTVAVRPSSARPALYVEGDYGKTTPTVGEGAKTGAGAGLAITGEMIAEDARAIFLVPIILPVAMIVGTIGGAAAAKVQQEIQEFRDNLTEELSEESNPPLGVDILGEALRARLAKSHDIDSILITTEDTVPEYIDAIVDIRVKDLTIMVDGNDAIMTTSAVAELRLTESDRVVYHKTFAYADKETLSNWVKDENALWTDYVDRARRHFTRAISNDFFEGILLRHVLRPTKDGDDDNRNSNSGKALWRSTVKTAKPMLSWELILLGDDVYGAWTEDIDATGATYELEVFNEGRLVYSANNIPTPYHEVETALEGCTTYSWSVRPHYQIDGRTRTGEWMNYDTRVGRIFRSAKAETPDFWRDFPKLEIRCQK
jgi:hypothetical protein